MHRLSTMRSVTERQIENSAVRSVKN